MEPALGGHFFNLPTKRTQLFAIPGLYKGKSEIRLAEIGSGYGEAIGTLVKEIKKRSIVPVKLDIIEADSAMIEEIKKTQWSSTARIVHMLAESFTDATGYDIVIDAAAGFMYTEPRLRPFYTLKNAHLLRNGGTMVIAIPVTVLHPGVYEDRDGWVTSLDGKNPFGNKAGIVASSQTLIITLLKKEGFRATVTVLDPSIQSHNDRDSYTAVLVVTRGR